MLEKIIYIFLKKIRIKIKLITGIFVLSWILKKKPRGEVSAAYCAGVIFRISMRVMMMTDGDDGVERKACVVLVKTTGWSTDDDDNRCRITFGTSNKQLVKWNFYRWAEFFFEYIHIRKKRTTLRIYKFIRI